MKLKFKFKDPHSYVSRGVLKTLNFLYTLTDSIHWETSKPRDALQATFKRVVEFYMNHQLNYPLVGKWIEQLYKVRELQDEDKITNPDTLNQIHENLDAYTDAKNQLQYEKYLIDCALKGFEIGDLDQTVRGEIRLAYIQLRDANRNLKQILKDMLPESVTQNL